MVGYILRRYSHERSPISVLTELNVEQLLDATNAVTSRPNRNYVQANKSVTKRTDVTFCTCTCTDGRAKFHCHIHASLEVISASRERNTCNIRRSFLSVKECDRYIWKSHFSATVCRYLRNFSIGAICISCEQMYKTNHKL